VALGAGLAGCVRVPSTARPAAPADIAQDRGWIAVAGIRPVRQKGQLDCGPAALAMVAQRWGVPLAAATRATARRRGHGSKLGALRAAARASGLTAFAIRADRATLVHELERGRPVLVGLLRGQGRRRLSHYEVVVGYHPQRGEFATIDPAAGFGVRRWRDLASEWEPAGRPALIVLGPATSRADRAGARAAPDR
jgi:ABC-type bacteriocin/lantibiotic exporter with double-glycine peptidase domain